MAEIRPEDMPSLETVRQGLSEALRQSGGHAVDTHWFLDDVGEALDVILTHRSGVSLRYRLTLEGPL